MQGGVQNNIQTVCEPSLCLFTPETSNGTYWCRQDRAAAPSFNSYIYNPPLPSPPVCVRNASRRKSSPVSQRSHRGAARLWQECACLSLLLITGPSEEQHTHSLPPSDGRPGGCHQLTPRARSSYRRAPGRHHHRDA